MAYTCVRGKKECDGCGLCLPWPDYEEEQKDVQCAPEPEPMDWDSIPDKWEGERL